MTLIHTQPEEDRWTERAYAEEIQSQHLLARLELLKQQMLLLQFSAQVPSIVPNPGPQTEAYYSTADIIGYGGAAGGGKSALIGMKSIHKPYRNTVVFRHSAKELAGFIQMLVEFQGNRLGLNEQKGVFNFSDTIPHWRCEWGGVGKPNEERSWQGREHALTAFDEITELIEYKFRYLWTWNRTTLDMRPQIIMTFNPPRTIAGRWVKRFFGPWLDKKHPKYPTPPGKVLYYLWDAKLKQDIEVEPDAAPLNVEVGGKVVEIHPRSRTFFKAYAHNNPFLGDEYSSTLYSLPETLRSQMMFGDFDADIQDNAYQVIPSEWIKAAMGRWTPAGRRNRMDAIGTDVGGKGEDPSAFARRHGLWWDEIITADTPRGPDVMSELGKITRDGAPVAIDVTGIGSSAADLLYKSSMPYREVVSNQSDGIPQIQDGMEFVNLRAVMWWQLRLLLNPENHFDIELPYDEELFEELAAPVYEATGNKWKVASKREIKALIGRSTNRADAVVYSGYDMLFDPTNMLTSRLHQSSPVDLEKLYGKPAKPVSRYVPAHTPAEGGNYATNSFRAL